MSVPLRKPWIPRGHISLNPIRRRNSPSRPVQTAWQSQSAPFMANILVNRALISRCLMISTTSSLCRSYCTAGQATGMIISSGRLHSASAKSMYSVIGLFPPNGKPHASSPRIPKMSPVSPSRSGQLSMTSSPIGFRFLDRSTRGIVEQQRNLPASVIPKHTFMSLRTPRSGVWQSHSQLVYSTL